jgi:transcriptional regulator with XRE-family HTH domain
MGAVLVHAPTDHRRVEVHIVSYELHALPPEQMTIERLLNEAWARYEAETGRKLTQAAFAEAVGMEQPTVNAWLNGKALPSVKSLEKVVAFFGADLDEWDRVRSREDRQRAKDAEQPMPPLRKAPALMIVPPDIESEHDPRFRKIEEELRRYLRELEGN